MFSKIKKADISLMLIAVIGLGLSLTAFFYVRQWEDKQIFEASRKQADAYVRTVSQVFTTFGTILYSINGLHNVLHHQVTREQFAQFVRNNPLIQPNVLQALYWVPYVPASQRQQIEDQAHLEGFSTYNFWEFSPSGEKHMAPQREHYYPILFTEPLSTSNLEWLGYDLATHDILKKALEEARDLGQLTASGGIPIQVEGQLKTGFFMFVPVYQENSPSTTIEQRRHYLVGFTVGMFLFDSLAYTVLRVTKLKTEVFLVILDETPGAKIKELFAPRWYPKDQTHPYSKTLLSVPLEFGGRQWQFSLFSIGDEELAFQVIYAWSVLTIGVLFTLGLWRYVYLTLTRARWAEDLVAARTQSLLEANEALNKEIHARNLITEALETSQQRFQAIFNEAAIGIAQLDLKNNILDSNRALQSLLRYREDELQNRFLREFAHPEDAENDAHLLEKMSAGKYDSYRIGKRYICKSGAIIWTNQSCSIVRDTNNPFIISMIEDITERKFAEEARLEAEKKYRDIFENAVEGIFQCTPSGQFLSVNPAFVRMFGYDSAEQLYLEVTDMGKQFYVDAQRRHEFLKALETHAEVRDFEYQARCRNNKIIWVNETTRVVRDGKGQIRYYEGIVEDVTHRKQIEETLRYEASHDQLTGLFNRAAFTTYLSEAISNLHRSSAQSSAEISSSKIDFVVLFIDLDRFKIVNDSLGHLVGDELLTEIARRLKTQTHQTDIVARFGGDEFALMLENLPDLTTLEQRIFDIQQYISQPYTLRNQIFSTTASIGIALASPRYLSADEVLRDADTAMYEAKKQGRGKAMIFQLGMHTHVVNLLRMESDIRKALERKEFHVHYQPIVSLEDGHVIGLEALVRWQHPQQGLVRPDLFIPLAEETGLIKELGLWVFETACTQLRQWQIQFHSYLGMNINVSPVQLKHPDFVEQIQMILEKTGITPSTCRVEITEGAMMQDPEAALKVFNKLKNLEVLLYVDDFGTGYSSLSYLQKFPIDALKIDKSFIRELGGSSKSVQIVQAIIALGKAFGLKIVAEGIEHDFQVTLLKEIQCHHGQGYFFSRPQDFQSIERYLSQSNLK